MVGKYDISVSSKKLHYDITVRRNITILSGNSGTGKTTLIRMILLSKRKDSPYKVICEKPCIAFTVDSYTTETDLSKYANSIIFLDEDIDFVRTEDFAKIVKKSSCYFVIATREELRMLPYSCKEIYRIDSHGIETGYKYIEDSMHLLYKFHVKPKIDLRGILSCIVVEDTNSGYQFFHALAQRLGIDCISARGNSNVVSVYEERVKQNIDTGILVIVDSAAYGAYYNALIEAIKGFHNTLVYLPESFEYVILCSGLFDGINEEVNNTYNYAESSMYFSWERYYTQLLVSITASTSLHYSKDKLNSEYLIPDNLKYVTSQFAEEMGLSN